MGLFDFLKPRDEKFRRKLQQPEMQEAMLGMKLDFVEKQVANLRAVGRKDDATKTTHSFMLEVLGQWKTDPANPAYLNFIARAAISLNELNLGRETLETALTAIKEGSTALLDLTLPYLHLGRIYHQLRNNPQRELACYTMATKVIAPPGCAHPASKRQKALAHDFAFMCASRVSEEEDAKYHDQKRRELAPDIDWDDPTQTVELIQSCLS